MSQPTVTVIIPAFRAARTIGRALESVLGQTRAPDEVLVIDDGSPDELVAALQPYRQSVILLRKTNGGAASARNLGLEHATGQFVAFCDADDYWEPLKVERQLAVFQRHANIGMVASRYFEQIPGCHRVGHMRDDASLFDRVLELSGEQLFAATTKVWTTTVMVRHSAVGGVRFDTGLSTAEDRDFWIRIMAVAPAYILSEPLATAVLEPNSLSRCNVEKDADNMLQVIRRNAGLLGLRGVRRWEANVFRQCAGVHLSQGRPRAAIRPAVRRLERQPLTAEAWWIAAKAATLALI